MVDGDIAAVNKSAVKTLWYRRPLSMRTERSRFPTAALEPLPPAAAQVGFPQLWKILWKIQGFRNWPS
jgi:hypothetical protein